MSKWEDITDILTPQGIERLRVGQVMLFDNEGIPIHLKIMRKRGGKVWAKHTHLYTEAELHKKIKRQRKEEDAIRTKKNHARD